MIISATILGLPDYKVRINLEDGQVDNYAAIADFDEYTDFNTRIQRYEALSILACRHNELLKFTNELFNMYSNLTYIYFEIKYQKGQETMLYCCTIKPNKFISQRIYSYAYSENKNKDVKSLITSRDNSEDSIFDHYPELAIKILHFRFINEIHYTGLSNDAKKIHSASQLNFNECNRICRVAFDILKGDKKDLASSVITDLLSIMKVHNVNEQSNTFVQDILPSAMGTNNPLPLSILYSNNSETNIRNQLNKEDNNASKLFLILTLFVYMFKAHISSVVIQNIDLVSKNPDIIDLLAYTKNFIKTYYPKRNISILLSLYNSKYLSKFLNTE
jgi:hypothetical protein